MPAAHDYSRLTDEELARQADDPLAFAELHGRLHPRLLSYLCSRIKDKHLADDLANEVWLKALPTIQGGSFTGKLTAWIITIAHNAVRDWLRRKKPAALSVAQEAALTEDDDRDGNNELLEHVARLRLCQEKLKPPRGQIVKLICAGLKPAAIAQQLQMEADAVHKLKFRAMQDLRDCLGVNRK
jgi:RNA polymerase sigma-70 factor, ECF subfamily